MSFPVYIHFGALRLHPHWIFETLAYALAFRLYLGLRRRQGDARDDANRWWIIAGLAYQNIFRVLIVQFLDAHAFDVRSVKKTCIHIVHPDGRLIPFDTYNLFYRDDLERTRLTTLRQRFVAPGPLLSIAPA